MQDDQNTSGVDNQNAEQTGHQDLETQSQDASGDNDERVSHKTYKQTVAEAKAMRARARAAEERLKALEDERLEAAGQKDELIKSLRSKLDNETKASRDLLNNFARRSLNTQLKNAAIEAGCIDPDAVMSLADLSAIEVSKDTFEADGGEIKSVINSLKKSKPYLFQKAGPNINARLPGGERVEAVKKDLKQMSSDEIRAELLRLGK